MDFYEELGVSERATDAEIRRSYKRLTMLLHPDHQQQDAELRALAEAQMKRLNEMIAILTNPEQRRSYDLSLQKSVLNVRQIYPTKNRGIRNNRGWMLVLILLLLFAVSAWLIPKFDEARSAAKVAAPLPVPLKTKEDMTRASSRVAASLRKRTRAEPDEPVEPLPLPEVGNTAGVPWGHSGAAPLDPLRDLMIPQPAFSPVLTTSGRWVYTPDPNDSRSPRLYPAIYVELAISEVDGTLRGSYRSRYKLPDRALNPFVSFAFDGDSKASTFEWRGESRAKGEVTLHLESADKLKVDWFATVMGSSQSLGSGSSTLYRFR